MFRQRAIFATAQGHALVTTYAVLRPDGQWSLLVVNKDQENAHTVEISFDDSEKGTSGAFSGAGERDDVRKRTVSVAPGYTSGFRGRPSRGQSGPGWASRKVDSKRRGRYEVHIAGGVGDGDSRRDEGWKWCEVRISLEGRA